MAALTPHGAHAHLSIIRQGHECAGANEATDRTGDALAAGDFNGDGYEDLAIGAPNEASNNLDDAGAVILCWGTSFGLTHEGSVIRTSDEMGGLDEADENVGFALTAADFNQDGYADLAVGAPGSTLGLGLADAGQVYVLAGSPNGLVPWHSITQATLGDACEAGDRFGASLAAGDLNGDGHRDLAIGCPGEDSFAGAVCYVLGTSIGLYGNGGTLTGASFDMPGAAGDRMGFSVASGNVIGTSHDDIITGLPYFDDAQPNAGAVWIIRGSATGPVTARPVFLTAWEFGGIQNNGLFGYAVAAGRLSSADYRWIAVGEPGRDVSGAAMAGKVHVARGGDATIDLSTALSLTETDFGSIPQSNDQFGLALAAGRFEAANDGFDELAIGAPGDGMGFTTSSGQVHIAYGGPNGPLGYGWAAFNQGTLNDPIEGFEELGTSLAFGRFDHSGKGGLAVGAPGEDDDAGQVHLIAPWRQVYGLGGLQSVAYDCEGNLVFSQKPFDQVCIASTTKTMTVLIACERSQLPPNDPRWLDLDGEMVIPTWVAEDIPGSQVPLVAGERINLRDLMYTCMLLSGNDAANAIAEFIYGGGPNLCLPLFVQEMNERAQQLGMLDTHFHNPAGLDGEPVGYDLGDHYSTPSDMAKLSRAAIENPLMAEIVGTISHGMIRHFPEGFNEWSDDPFVVNNIFGGVLMNNIQPATGIKGGGTPCAKSCGLFSAQDEEGGQAIAGFYLMPPDHPQYGSDAANLLKLGLAECGYTLIFSEDWLWQFFVSHLSTYLGDRAGGGGGIETFRHGDDAVLDLFRQTGEGTTAARLDLRRSAEILFGPSQIFTFGISPFDEHGDIVFTNMGDAPAVLHITRSYNPRVPIELRLEPGEKGAIPAYASPTPLSDLTLTISNRSGIGAAVPAHVGCEEPYGFELTGIRTSPDPLFSALLKRQQGVQEDNVQLLVTGRDPVAGSEIYLAMHDQGVTTASPGPLVPPSGVAERLTIRPAAPNPFHERTRIAFDLAAPGVVGFRVFDAQGRLVRDIGESRLQAGRWSADWDGTLTGGAHAPQGTYFYRLTLDGEPIGEGKVIKIAR